MDNDLRHTDDISQLWGTETDDWWEPAPGWRPVLPAEQARPSARNGNGDGQADRLDALERDVRTLAQVVARVEVLVEDRLNRLERQVAALTAGEERRGDNGISRLSDLIKPTRDH